jgi:hypothetical protein
MEIHHCSERPSRCFAQRKGCCIWKSSVLNPPGYSDPAADALLAYGHREASRGLPRSGTVRLTECNEMRHAIVKLDRIIGMGVGERHSCRAVINSALA